MNDDAVKEAMRRIGIARRAIVGELEQRLNEGDDTVRMNAHSEGIDDQGEPSNYVSGGGSIRCPVCNDGKLRYSRSSYNGHIHARCQTIGCVEWME
jgi:hypothetical protein